MTSPAPAGGKLGLYLDTLLSCYALALTEAEALPCRLSKVPTPVPALDICCECEDGEGQAWVSFNRLVPVGEAIRGAPCATMFEATFNLGIARCVPSMDDEGNAPSGEELDAAVEKQMRDFLILRAAACCWAENLKLPNSGWRYGDYALQPASGGCQVATLTLIARVPFGCC